MTKGIDISYAQKNADFSKLKDFGIDFVIIRAGYGRLESQKDAMFESHYEAAKKTGLKTGCYWYSYAQSPEEAELEAQVCLSTVKGKEFEYPVCFDIEEKQTVLGSDTVSEIIKSFCHTIENSNYYAMLYSYANFLKDYVKEDVRKRFDVWVAHTGVEQPNYTLPYGIWQFSHTGAVDGINGNVDLNYAYKDYETIIKKNGLNGFNKSTPVNQYREYKVKKGDSLWTIAEKELGSGTRYMEIANLNNINTQNIIYPDQNLKIPQ